MVTIGHHKYYTNYNYNLLSILMVKLVIESPASFLDRFKVLHVVINYYDAWKLLYNREEIFYFLFYF